MKNSKLNEQIREIIVKHLTGLVESGISQSQIARDCGVSQSLISELINGNRGSRPQARTLMALVNGAGVPIKEILAVMMSEEEVELIAMAKEDERLWKAFIRAIKLLSPEKREMMISFLESVDGPKNPGPITRKPELKLIT